MKGKVFLDTNILVYCYSKDEPTKQQAAIEVASLSEVLISTQVLQEMCNTMSRKFKLSWVEIETLLAELNGNFKVQTNTFHTIRSACRIASVFKFSFYDSLIVAAALEAGCEVLYSEDLQDGQIIENQLLVKNPFAKI